MGYWRGPTHPARTWASDRVHDRVRDSSATVTASVSVSAAVPETGDRGPETGIRGPAASSRASEFGHGRDRIGLDAREGPLRNSRKNGAVQSGRSVH